MIKPDYKKVSELKPHCPNCKEQLRGNGSVLFGFKCSCGAWVPDHSNPYAFQIVKESKSDKT